MTAATATELHEKVDAVIRRQQGKLLNRQRDLGTLTPALEGDICRSFGWTGHDLHQAIDELSTEAAHAPVAVR